jgi:hypothetical protein
MAIFLNLDLPPHMLKRFYGISQMSNARPLGRWPGSRGLDELLSLNEVVVGRMINDNGLRRLALDVDGEGFLSSLES